MKKRKFFFPLALAAVLMCAPMLFAACADGTDGGGGKSTAEIKWYPDLVGNMDEGHTAFSVTFTGAVENLTAADVTVGGVAALSGEAFIKSADSKVWTIPIAVSEEGHASIKISKAGIKSQTFNVTQVCPIPKTTPSGEITWTLGQVGGAAGTATTTAIKITFSGDVDSLTAAETSIGGVATIKAGALPTADAADKKNWTIPVTVTSAGEATVAVNQPGVQFITKTVAVFFKSGGDTPPVDGEFANANGFPAGYEGTPFTSTATNFPAPYPNQPEGQKIPGIVMCAYYDNGPLGVAFQDAGGNTGGALRTGNPCVDVKFSNNGDDGNNNHIVPPVIGRPYVGWTNGGEWFRLTTVVEEDGVYEVKLCYAKNGANDNLVIWFDEDKKFPLNPTRTGYYHYWNTETVIETMSLKAGKSVLTVKLETGGFNIMYFEFVLKE
ncbi:MAG: DUF5010 C-terminal domain-containing protein [Firmicutes bacterium]|nr:DUF5010 C-terminal domain-containing protein [Bacillota bacterium]